MLAKTRAYLTQAAVPYGTLVDVRPLHEAFAALGEHEAKLRGRIAAIVAEAYWHARQTDTARQQAALAYEIGRQSGDDWVCSYASHVLALTCMQSLHPHNALESWQTALAFARRANDLWLQGAPGTRLPWVLTGLGRPDEAETQALEACTLTRKVHNWAEYSFAVATLAVIARGRHRPTAAPPPGSAASRPPSSTPTSPSLSSSGYASCSIPTAC